MESNRKSFLYGSLAVVFWSTIATAFKIALVELSPGQLLLIASITSVAVLTIITFMEGSTHELFNITKGSIVRSALLALLNPFIYYLILLRAYKILPAQVAQPLNMIWPIVLVFLSVPLLKQKVSAKSYISLLFSFIGVYIVASQGSLFKLNNINLEGVLLAAGSSIFWALYFIFNLRDKRRESVKLLANFIIATIYLIIFLFATDGFTPISTRGLISGIYIGIFEMGLTFFLWLTALKLATSADRISNLVFLAPFISLIFISLILHEKIHLTTPLGLILIIGSIIYQNHSAKAVSAPNS